MGTSFGTTKNPIVIDDDEPTGPNFGPQPRSKSPHADETIEIGEFTFSLLVNIFLKDDDGPKTSSKGDFAEDDEDLVRMFRAQSAKNKEAKKPKERPQETYQPKFPAGKTWEAQAPNPAPSKPAMSSAQQSNEEIKRKFREQLKAKRAQKEAGNTPPPPQNTTYTPTKSHEDIFREEMLKAQNNAFGKKKKPIPTYPPSSERTSARKRPASPIDKRAQNEKLFDTLIYEPSSSKKSSTHKKSSNAIDPKFEAELKRLKEKKAKEKEDRERAEKLAKEAEEEKKARNAQLFEDQLRKSSEKETSKSSRTEVREDFAEELKRLKEKKAREKAIKEKAAKIAAMVHEISSESSSEDDDEDDDDEDSEDEVVDLTKSSRELLIEQLKRKKALAMARARAEEKLKQEKQRVHLENLAGYDDNKTLDKSDTKLLFSQKW